MGFTNEQAEAITERLLESKELHSLLEHLLRGNINEKTFNIMLSDYAETFHLNITEEQKEIEGLDGEVCA